MVTVAHGIDNAFFVGLRGEAHAGEHIGLDVDHDDVLARLDGGERMGNAGNGVTCCLDHHLDCGILTGVIRLIGEARAGDARRLPTHGTARLPRSIRIEIGNHHHLDPSNRGHLREEHGAKLAGTDQTDAYWLARQPRGELVLQAHSAAMW